MCLSLLLEKFNFDYAFQDTKYPNKICSFYTIFNILFCFKKLFYTPCEKISAPPSASLVVMSVQCRVRLLIPKLVLSSGQAENKLWRFLGSVEEL